MSTVYATPPHHTPTTRTPQVFPVVFWLRVARPGLALSTPRLSLQPQEAKKNTGAAALPFLPRPSVGRHPLPLPRVLPRPASARTCLWCAATVQGGGGRHGPFFSVGAGVGSWLLAAPASKLMGTRMKYRDDALPITHPPLTHPPTHPPTHPRLTGSVMASTSDLDEQIERLRYVTRQAFPDWTDGVRKQQGGGCGS